MENRFNDYSSYLKNKFKEKVKKITIDASFTCPNRDGSKGVGGCTYCNNDSFVINHKTKMSIEDQVNQAINNVQRTKKINKFIVYFQAYSNTYAPLDELKEIYSAALKHPLVVGISIGTRPDCIDEEKLIYLESLTKTHEVVIEYGLESIKDETLQWINRCHTFDEFKRAINLTKIFAPNVLIATHVIIGFPTETKFDWMEMADVLSSLEINFLKLHQLHIVKHTKLAKIYLEKPFKVLTLEEYLDVVVEFIERLDSKIVLQRVFGITLKELLIAPHFREGADGKLEVNSARFMKLLNERLKARNSVQGSKSTYLSKREAGLNQTIYNNELFL